MPEIKIDESTITFGIPKYCLGQKISVMTKPEKPSPGHITGIQKGKFVWMYCVLDGEVPSLNSSEQWYTEFQLAPFTPPDFTS